MVRIRELNMLILGACVVVPCDLHPNQAATDPLLIFPAPLWQRSLHQVLPGKTPDPMVEVAVKAAPSQGDREFDWTCALGNQNSRV